ncbi:MAG: fused MFS/spermidine synthase [Candidatus Omnitrophota bacterium]|nr:fused MFS/spermidine synthase [Candidatus Omnitrophota bacterium]MDZ4241218.1 fused MFS/spermidine synthase [Candidatus Omnitrophota bacterium]
MPPAVLRVVIFSFFFVSGVCGLVYEVLWAKYLSNIFGSTAYAHTLVLAVFMGGLALGNALFGKTADKTKTDLLYFYGVLEIGIGLYCILYPNIADLIELIYLNVGGGLGLSSTHPGLLGLQFLLNSVTILVPTALMGGTLPVMTKYLTRRKEDVLREISGLYFLNSAGAVLGSLACGFFFIRLWGMDTSITVAAMANMAVGLTAMGLSRKLEIRPEPKDASAADLRPPASEEGREDAALKKIILISIFASGFASMLYEVLWIRVLIQFFGSSVYSFSTVVAAFIAGIALGSAWLKRRGHRIHDTVLYFGLIQGMIAVTMSLCASSINIFAEGIWLLHRLFAPVDFAYPIYLLTKFLVIFGILSVPCFFIGMTLPLAGAAYSRNLQRLGQDVGGVFSANTWGALAGTAVTGLFLLPLAGTQNSFLIGILINTTIASLTLLHLRTSSARRSAILLLATIIGLLWIAPIRIDKTILLSTMFRYRDTATESLQEYLHERFSGEKILFYREDRDGNVAVVKENDSLILYINGKPDASSTFDMPTQLLSGHIPALLHSQPKKVLVIGFGSGVTVGALTHYPSIERIDCLEISRAVIEAGHFFKDVNSNCLTNKKVRIIIDDAKNFLALNREKYDVIISEPTNPWTAGTGSLMTVEFFKKVQDALNPGGIFLQWFHGYEMSRKIFFTFTSTLTKSFPYISVWQPSGMDYFFLSTGTPLETDFPALRQKFQALSDVRKNLGIVNADSLYTILSTQVLSVNAGAKLFDRMKAPPNKDRFPAIEFNAPRAFFLREKVSLSAWDERIKPSGKKGLLISRLLEEYPLERGDMVGLYHFLKERSPALYYLFSEKYVDSLAEAFQDNPEERNTLERVRANMNAEKTFLDYLDRQAAAAPDSSKLFADAINFQIEIYGKRYSIFSQNPEDRAKIQLSLEEAVQRFPEEQGEWLLRLADFHDYHHEYGAAMESYFQAISQENQQQTGGQPDFRKRALTAALGMSLREQDLATFEILKALYLQEFPLESSSISQIEQAYSLRGAH